MKALPYVYRLTHKISGQFYIGYREANILPSFEDILIYQSSSQKVLDLGFDNFHWEIIAEFWKGEDANIFENELIKNSICDPLCLNGHYVENGKYRRVGPHSDESRKKMSDVKMSRRKPRTVEHRAKLSEARKLIRLSKETYIKIGNALRGRKLSEEHKAQTSQTLMGHIISKETKKKISQALLGHIQTNETKEKRSKSMMGKSNVKMSKRCVLQGKEYPNITAATNATGLTHYLVKKDPTFELL